MNDSTTAGEPRVVPPAPLSAHHQRMLAVESGIAPAVIAVRGGGFVQWLSPRSPVERQARRQQAMAQRPPSAAPLASLTALGDSGPMPASMAEARARIGAALQRVEVRA